MKTTTHVLKSMLPVTDPESCRYALGGVLLQQREGSNTVNAVATDGMRLLAVTIEQETRAMESAEAVVSANGIKAAAKMETPLKSNPDLGRFTTHLPTANGKLRAEITTRQGPVEMDLETLEGRFPKWENVIPAATYETSVSRLFEYPNAVAQATVADDAHLAVRIDPKMLAELLLAVSKVSCDDESRGVDLIVPVDPGKPLTIRAQSDTLPDSAAVLMPMAR